MCAPFHPVGCDDGLLRAKILRGALFVLWKGCGGGLPRARDLVPGFMGGIAGPAMEGMGFRFGKDVEYEVSITM